MRRQKSLNSVLKAVQPELRQYVRALESENLKLQKQIARLEAQDVTKQHRIVALEGEMKKLTKKHGYHLTIHLGDQASPPPSLGNGSSPGAAFAPSQAPAETQAAPVA